jgi:cyclopropane fatty-acyl-phospholipid synthase-like methyltransferase
MLEIGAGTGEHAVHLAAALPDASWFTGDPDPTARASIAAWIEDAQLPNLHGPHAIDVSSPDWGSEGASLYDGIVSINMIHIAPFAAARGLFEGAGRLLRPGGKLFLYGPFSRHGRHTAPSNEAFDQSLKSRDPRWGVRDLDHDLLPLAERAGLVLEAAIDMPTNNLCVLFRRLP